MLKKLKKPQIIVIAFCLAADIVLLALFFIYFSGSRHPDPTIEYTGRQEIVLNINTATQEELETLSGIGPVTAQAIISYREENGKFNDIHDITLVKGIGEKTFENIMEHIMV